MDRAKMFNTHPQAYSLRRMNNKYRDSLRRIIHAWLVSTEQESYYHTRPTVSTKHSPDATLTHKTVLKASRSEWIIQLHTSRACLLARTWQPGTGQPTHRLTQIPEITSLADSVGTWINAMLHTNSVQFQGHCLSTWIKRNRVCTVHRPSVGANPNTEHLNGIRPPPKVYIVHIQHTKLVCVSAPKYAELESFRIRADADPDTDVENQEWDCIAPKFIAVSSSGQQIVLLIVLPSTFYLLSFQMCTAALAC